MTDQDHKLGEVLRTAREAKEVDLARVERDTKIRERYLPALEDGEYRELPGAVYTKGFLRNYGAYLGLDPEYLIDLYRLETRAAAPRARESRAAAADQHAPQPAASSSRRARSWRRDPDGGRGDFIAYLGYEFVNFARTPSLGSSSPPATWRRTRVDYHHHRHHRPTRRSPSAGCPRTRPSPPMPTATSTIMVGLLPGSNVIRLNGQRPDDRPPAAVTSARSWSATRRPSVEGSRWPRPARRRTPPSPAPCRCRHGTARSRGRAHARRSSSRRRRPSGSTDRGRRRRDGPNRRPSAPGAPASPPMRRAPSAASRRWRRARGTSPSRRPRPRSGHTAVTVGPGDGLSATLRLTAALLPRDRGGRQPVAGVSGASSTTASASRWRPMSRCASASATPAPCGSWSTASAWRDGRHGAVVEWRITRR